MAITKDMEDRELKSTLTIPQRSRDASRPLISVVVPIYNEEACLRALHKRLTEVLASLKDDYEILLVDDGSRDGSLQIICELARRDPHLGYLTFTRNFGHEAATTGGLEHSSGQTVVVIDADLQDPPELIPEMLRLWREGCDLVYAQRRRRAGETALTRWTSYLFYRLLKRFVRGDVPLDTGDFRLMDRAVVDAFKKLRERNRFVRGLIAWTGFQQKAVLYDRDPRLAGQTKYNFFKRFQLALDAICGMTVAPLRWMTYLGGIMTAVSFAVGLLAGSLRFLFSVGVEGWVLLAAAVFFVGSVQLLSLGALGEYVGRIYIEVQAKPLYLLAGQHYPAAAVLRSQDTPTAA